MRHVRARACLLVVGLLSGAALASAQAPADGKVETAQPAEPKPSGSARTLPRTLTPRIQDGLNRTKISVGEVTTLKIEVDAESTVSVSLPEQQALGGLEQADRRSTSETRNGRTKTVYELDLLALEAGTVKVPALTLRIVGPNGELGDVHTKPQQLVVQSLIANEPNAAPKAASKPLVVMHDDYTLAWVALGLVAIALIAGATLLASRWLKQRPVAPVAPPPPRPPWEVALEKLHQLDAKREDLIADNRGGEFVDGVSEALREYLGRRYGFDGLERTTGELLATLEAVRPAKLSLSGVSLVLEQCDLVKFARATPDREECDDLWHGALDIVHTTMGMENDVVMTAGRPSLGPTPNATQRFSALPPAPGSAGSTAGFAAIPPSSRPGGANATSAHKALTSAGTPRGDDSSARKERGS